MTTLIPQPPGWPVIGNFLDRGKREIFARKYGPIYQLQIGILQQPKIFICSAELLAEICNERIFCKNPTSGGLNEVRNLTHDGLFTARPGEENWGIAHRVLMPALGSLAVGSMFEDMYDICCQLVLKWARTAPNTPVAATEDFTRLTLDTLALCTMDTRFNSFYSETPHPFVSSMVSFLQESGIRSVRPSFVSDYIYRESTRQYWDDVKVMRDTAQQVLESRRKSSLRKGDLVDAMINGVDPKTKMSLSEENVIDNMITFLIAGHETTSGLLSFALYELIKHPDAFETARKEVDKVLGQELMTPASPKNMSYISAIIRETLRLHPTAPAFSLMGKSQDPADYPIFIGKERYPVQYGQTLIADLAEIHKDASVYGDDAHEFKPERMLDDAFAKLPRGAWKPFGEGSRSCIGRGFAIQEATMILALLVQNFDFSLANPGYQLAISKTLTVKPKDFQVLVHHRSGYDLASLPRRLFNTERSASPGLSQTSTLSTDRALSVDSEDLTDMIICFGSNAGTCQTLAHTLANGAQHHGFRATVVPMNEAVELVSEVKDPIVVITASYEGEPPDNATGFVKWLSDVASDRKNTSPLGGRVHAVYGCGHRDWTATYHKIPIWVDDTLTSCGSKAVTARGVSDAADGNTANDFDVWADGHLWPALRDAFQKKQNDSQNDRVGKDGTNQGTVGIELVRSRRINELQNSCEAIVLESRSLTAPGVPEKRHITLQLPSEVKYVVGDYLGVLPVNPDETVRAVMNHFKMAIDDQVVINQRPVQDVHAEPLRTGVYSLLREHVELNIPATDKNIRAIAETIPEMTQREFLLTKTVASGVKEPRLTAIQLLRLFPSATLTFSEYVRMLPPLRVRLYSISSSPMEESTSCDLTYSMLGRTNNKSCSGNLQLIGAASNYLAELKHGDRLWVSVRPGHHPLHMAANDTKTPVILVCAGSGLAPFRAFVQQRAHLMKTEPTSQLPKCFLLIGCRHPDKDALYAQELQNWAATGNVEIRYAYSTAEGQSGGCKYVQDILWKSRSLLMPLIVDDKAKVVVCGSSKVVEGVTAMLLRGYASQSGESRERAEAWFRTTRKTQFFTEVFN